MGVPRAPQNPLLGVAGHGQKVPAGPGRGSLHPGPGTAPPRIRTPLPGEGILVGPPHQGTLASAAPLPPIPSVAPGLWGSHVGLFEEVVCPVGAESRDGDLPSHSGPRKAWRRR